MQLSKNFHLNEFLISKDYPELARKIQPDDTQINRLKFLCDSVLQPLRDKSKHSKGGIMIMSGLRSDELNNKIGGSKDSDQLHAIAADITSLSPFELFCILHYEKFPFRQLIYYPESYFVHVSINIPGRHYKNESFIKNGSVLEKYN